MGVFRSVAGQLHIEITGADIPFIFKRLTRAGIVLYNAVQIDDLTVQASIVRKNITIVRSVVSTCGGAVKILQKNGIVFAAKKIFKRPFLMVTVALLIFMSVYIPSRIFFVKVEGNSYLESMYIAEKASECGLCFGVSREQVRSEKIKNELIQIVPELDWVGINTYGCVAVIHVKEKEVSQKDDNKTGVSSIVASRDGIIENITVIKGVALCKPGQAVSKGQTLISGYEDCGIVLKATAAEGEINARTLRQVEVLCPSRSIQRTDVTYVEQKYSVIIGKKQINLYKDSGISGASCVKMYSDYYLTLPGGFVLPVGISVQTVYHYEVIDEPSQLLDESFVVQYAKGLIIDQMVAGSILNEQTDIQHTDELTIFNGSYSCLEMIGQVKNEELIYGENR
jgi:sporulation protein YqfD